MQMNHHPKALPYLFLTEMWERFGFYVVQGLLVLYMSNALGYSDKESFTLTGTFTACAYFAPILGGFVADRYITFKIAIIWGGIFLCLGYALFASGWPHSFYFGLASIVVGTGLFKSNISSLLGILYGPKDNNRDAGFTLFYIGINIGALLAGLTSGFIKNHYGWHTAFALASFGLIIGLIIFLAAKYLGFLEEENNLSFVKKRSGLFLQLTLLFYSLLLIVVVSVFLERASVETWFFPIAALVMLVALFSFAFKQQGVDRKRLLTFNILIISAVVFWMLFWQIYFSANLFINRVVHRDYFGIHLTTTAFYSLESIFIIILGPFFASLWQRLNENNTNPSFFGKFILSIVMLGIGFFILSVSTFFPDSYSQINPLWIVSAYFFITIGELLLSPIGLSAVTLLAPASLTGLMMGVWFTALGFGGAFGGFLADLSDIPKATAIANQLPIYRHAFLDYTYISIVVVVILWLIKKRVKI